jgi:phosphoribosylamine-glycine ligase
VRGHAAHSEYAANATHGIRPAAKADEKYAIAGSPQAQNGGIAVDNVSGDAEPGTLANQIVNFAREADLDLTAVGARPEARIVEGKLTWGSIIESGPTRAPR